MDAQHERGSNPRQTSSKSRINLTFHRDSILHRLLPLPSAHPSMASLSSIWNVTLSKYGRILLISEMLQIFVDCEISQTESLIRQIQIADVTSNLPCTNWALVKKLLNSSLPFYSILCCSFISFENLLWTFVNINIWIAFEGRQGRDGFKLHFAFQIFLWWVPGWTDPHIRAFSNLKCCLLLLCVGWSFGGRFWIWKTELLCDNSLEFNTKDEKKQTVHCKYWLNKILTKFTLPMTIHFCLCILELSESWHNPSYSYLINKICGAGWWWMDASSSVTNWIVFNEHLNNTIQAMSSEFFVKPVPINLAQTSRNEKHLLL